MTPSGQPTTTTGPATATAGGTIVHRFRSRTAGLEKRPALRARRGDEWETITWGAYGLAVEEGAAGLMSRGVQAGDRVGLLCANRPEWHISDMAILSTGAVTVPVYPTSSSSQVAYVLADSGASACVVEDAHQLAKVLLHANELPELRTIVLLDGEDGLDHDDLVVGLARLRAQGRHLLDDDPVAVLRRVNEIGPEDLATLVYTSGTTGAPKGTRISHANITWTIHAVTRLVPLSSDDRFLSYLPLSHIAERVTSHFGQIVAGGETWFARSLVTVREDLAACRPTIFFAVPRVWQKFQDAITDALEEQPAPVRSSAERYLAAGHRVVEARQLGQRPRARDLAVWTSLDRTLGSRLRHQLGLDQARYLVSSAAPIHPDLVRWFHALGLPVAEVWGQTEDTGPATANPPHDIRIGTIGRALPGLEVTVADDGELLVRGGSVSGGYHHKPEATAELIDADGWLHSGDLGSIDADGFVRITGRKKDLIINAAGKNISPSEIETRLSMEPLIGQAVVVGDGRRYLVGLLTLDADAAAEWARRHSTFGELADLVQNPALREEVAASVERVNREHAPVEQLKAWRLLPEALSVEGGELTPTMKVKRSVVAERHADLIEEMYAS